MLLHLPDPPAANEARGTGSARWAQNLQAFGQRDQKKIICKAHAVLTPTELPPAYPAVPPLAEIVETRYGRMIVPIHDTAQTPPLRYHGLAAQWPEIDRCIAYIEHRPPGAVFLDIGANVGTFAFALRPFCAAVHAWEPQRIICGMLAGSVALNGWTNVYWYNAAVGYKPIAIDVPQFDYGTDCSFGSIEFGARQIEPLTQQRGYDPNRVEYVVVERIDDRAWRRIDLIKIDVEGMELDVLKGAEHTIERHRPAILIEHQKTGIEPLYRWLADRGYRSGNVGVDLWCLPSGGR